MAPSIWYRRGIAAFMAALAASLVTANCCRQLNPLPACDLVSSDTASACDQPWVVMNEDVKTTSNDGNRTVNPAHNFACWRAWHTPDPETHFCSVYQFCAPTVAGRLVSGGICPSVPPG